MIAKKDIESKIKLALDKKSERKFSQAIDLSIGLKGIDLKNQSNAIEEYIVLPFTNGSDYKLCGLVDKELQTEAKNNFERVIMKDDFDKFGNKKDLKKLASEYTYFVAQANIMALIAKTFGRVFGPRGKMPSPKANCVVPANVKLDALKNRLKRTVLISAKKSPVFNVKVGNEKQKTEEIVENIMTILEFVIKRLPNGEQNVKHAYLKTSMGESVKLM
ncbi:MAG: 50S ribosomal protein L1 [Candidatus Nanoarchaeia archaeon]|nr:50S ribosomal protein L1 [Candidatus Nanoarchaeia archaeon]